MLPFCEGAQATRADERGADADNIIRALAEAFRVDIMVGTDDCPEPYNYRAPAVQGSRAAWKKCQLYVASKPGHYSTAWV